MLTHFDSFEHQDRLDLEYGQQLAACERLVKSDTAFHDHSTDGAWTPDED